MTVSHETQIELENEYSKWKLLPKLREIFSELCEDSFIKDLLSQMFLHKQCDIETLVGILTPKHGTAQEVADLVIQAIEQDFLDYNTDTDKLVFIYRIDDDSLDSFAKYQYPLPMLTKPRYLKCNFNGTGYLTDTKSCVVTTNAQSYRNKPTNLYALNTSNSVPLSLDMDTIALLDMNELKPKRKAGESKTDFKDREKQFILFFSHSLEVMQSMYIMSDTFYLTHKYDSRGRMYVEGYHVNPQGTSYQKSVYELANKEVVKDK